MVHRPLRWFGAALAVATTVFADHPDPAVAAHAAWAPEERGR